MLYMALTEDDLKNMSPEEIIELQKKNCIFCRIIKGEVSSKRVYEDDKVLAILDINPANPGHILLLPKEHYMILPQIPPDLIGYMFIVAKHLSRILMKAVGSTGTNIFIANGAVAGQRAPHFMIHIIPRIDGDNISVFNLSGKKTDEKTLTELRTRISEVMNSLNKSRKQEPKLIGEVTETINPKDNKKKNPVNQKMVEGRRPSDNSERGNDRNKDNKADLDDITNLLLGK